MRQLGYFTWLVRLRWLVILIETLTLLTVFELLHLPIDPGPALAVIFIAALSNIALPFVPERIREQPLIVITILALDVSLLTVLLYFGGGPDNPFSILYLLHVVLASVLLSRAWAWCAAALTSVLFGSLFLAPSSHSIHGHSLSASHSSHLFGMWVAYTLVALVTAYCVTHISAELRRRERESERLRLNEQRLISLTTLAAGAAHELGTPLGTIAVILGELRRPGSPISGQPGAEEDLRLMADELERCRQILSRMGESSGEVAGETPVPVGLGALVEEVSAAARSQFGAAVNFQAPAEDVTVALPRRAIVRALTALVKNGADASAGGSVSVEASRRGEFVRFTVNDTGHGIPASDLARLGEPFFTTKAPGEGMGLGVFLAKLTAEGLGGALRHTSTVGRGTSAELTVRLSSR